MFAALEVLSIAVSIASLSLAVCIVGSRPREQYLSVWCETRHLQTTVAFVERRQSDRVIRCVLRCPLRAAGERCSEMCLRLGNERIQLPAASA